jgi:hypothetical protein
MNDSDGQPLTLEDQVEYLRIVTEAFIWGPHLADREYRQKIAGHLYLVAEAAARHQSEPPAVLRALLHLADSLAELDNMPDALRPALRPFVPPPDSGAE